MKKKIVFIALSLVLVITLALGTATQAAGPADNPGKGPPSFGKIVFVHYPKGEPAKGGIPGPPDGKGNGDEENGGKLWYKYSGIHWADASIPVPYLVNLADSGGDGSFLGGIQAAFQTWEDDEGSYIDFTYSGSFEGPPSSFTGAGSMNYSNEVGWTSLADYPNAIAVTVIWYNLYSREIAEVDMAMNRDLHWSQTVNIVDPDEATGNTNAYDVQNIVTHEAGHWLLLEDLYQKPAGDQTMYGYGAMGELKKRSLESGDVAGVQEIYPGAEMPS